jgi:6-phosphogluconolactonase
MTLSRRWFLAATAALFSSLTAFAAEPPKSGKYWVYYGPYTSKGKSEGVYRSELNAATGELSKPELAATVGSPSFLHIAPNGKTIYAVGEAAGGKDGGGVYSWKLHPATGKLSDQVSLTSGGSGPCHISTDAKNEFAIVANYSGGSTAVFKLKEDGSLDKRTSFVQHKGSSVNPNRQKEPHAHCGFFEGTGKLAFVCDLGLDQVLLYDLDRSTGELKPHDPPYIKMPAGSGPRHIHIAPKGHVAFVNGELDMTLNVVAMDLSKNKFEVVQSLPTISEADKKKPGNSTAETRIHPNGKFVYVSNRGHNSITVYEFLNATVVAKAIGQITGDIKTPRNFNITPCGKWMLIASQDGGKVGVYAIDPDTGMAKETEYSAKIDGCVCVKFLARE